MRHRQDLLAQRLQAKSRASASSGKAIKALLTEQIVFLSQQIKQLDQKIAQLLERPDLKPRREALRGIKGVGPVCAATLLALAPELGTLTPKTAASLMGLAPHPRESGTQSGHRRMTGGRAGVKPIVFMSAVARKLVVIANAKIRDSKTETILT